MDMSLLKGGGLELNTADIMVENVIGTIGVPLGVSPNFVINGKHLVVPMAVEEVFYYFYFFFTNWRTR